jgi:hypothetical protein
MQSQIFILYLTHLSNYCAFIEVFITKIIGADIFKAIYLSILPVYLSILPWICIYTKAGPSQAVLKQHDVIFIMIILLGQINCINKWEIFSLLCHNCYGFLEINHEMIRCLKMEKNVEICILVLLHWNDAYQPEIPSWIV